MDSKELRSLMEAYQQINAPQEVEEVEQVDEGKSDRPLGVMHHFARGVKQKRGAKKDEGGKYLSMQHTKKQNKKEADADAYRERQRVQTKGTWYREELEQVDEADSLAAMQARREKRLARQRKQMGTSSTGQDFGHDYGISSAERKKRQQAEFDKFVGRGKKTTKEEVENVEEGLRDKVGEKVKKHINKYAYKQGIHNNPGWLRKPEKRAALNKAVRDDIKKNPKAAVQYAAGEVKRKVKEKLRKEEFDVFDTILEFLIDEEIAQDIQEANWIMANAITEEQIDEILGMFKKKPEKKTEYAGRSMEPVKKDPGYTVDKRRPEVSVTIYGKGGKTDKFKSRGPVR